MNNEGETPSNRKGKASHHGSQKRQRERGFMVRATAEEYAAIRERAANAGLTAGGFLRACALGDSGPRAQHRPPVAIQQLGKAVAELNKIGSNVNQIARALNSGHRVMLPEIQKASEELSIAIKAILEAAGKT